MAAKENPNSSATVPVLIPPWLDRVLFKHMNPITKRASRYLPGASIIEHRGRKSGKPYETVVTTYRKGNRLAVGLGHGRADWVRNVLAAGEADVRLFRGRRVHISNPRILPVGTADKSLSLAIRLQRRRVAVLVADITDPAA